MIRTVPKRYPPQYLTNVLGKESVLEVIIEEIYKFLITSLQYGIDEILLSTQESNSLSIGPVTIS